MNVFLAVILAASPTLKVRVLEHEKLVAAELSAAALACDGAPLGKSAKITLEKGRLAVGAQRCEGISGAEVSVRFGETQRRYHGALSVRVIDGFLAFFDDVDAEQYLKSVVASEAAGPKALLQAQAVVSRTFALTARGRHQKSGYDLCDLTHCQLYRGAVEERDDASAAVAATLGEVLLVGKVVLQPAYFHSSCGGATSSQRDVFHDRGPDESVKDGDLDSKSPDFSWEWTVSRRDLSAGLGLKDDGTAFESLARDSGGRVLELRSFGERFSGTEYLSRIGQRFGWQQLKSMHVSADEANGAVHFTGRGLGHGVGLCQFGAQSLAEKGDDYKAILRHYFPTREVGQAPAVER